MTPAVWSPRAQRVDLVVDGGQRRPMAACGGGWFEAGTDLAPGTGYWFALDGSDELLPDPRSEWQPRGIEGPSAVVDHAAFRWTDEAWRGRPLPGGVLYELHVGTFSAAGTFDGAIEHLDHLVALGVDAVEVMPVAEAMGTRGWGYDGVLLFATHHAYGGPDGFKRFVDACHARGLAVVLDVVYNHLGPKGNHLGRFGPYFSAHHQTPWGDGLNLDDEGATEVRRFVLDNARHWFVDHHVDGLRLDAVHALLDDSPTHLLAELATSVRGWSEELGRPLWLSAEREQNELVFLEWGLDARWSDDLHHALHSAITGETAGYYESFGRVEDVRTAVERVHVRPGDDVPDDVTRHAFVTCAQNHDQVGNRAGGERLSHLAGIDAQLCAAAIVLCSPGTPLLFQGEEWAASAPFPYFVDPDGDEGLAAAIRDGRRGEFAAFGWAPDDVPDPVDPATFRAAKLDWAELADEPHARALAVYRALLGLRRHLPDLRDGRRATVRVDVDEAARTVVVHRAETVLAVNLAGEPRPVRVGAVGDLLLATDETVGHGPVVTLPGHRFAVFARA